ncbi:hypothetical protein BYT27DRAFT_7181730 [Phlegmacium glaucopus]|nr:hypothetical protein BYT27DRAFT_7181730 [Phlegmacium glaucopus]
MQAQYRPLPYARLNTFHGPKRQLLGNQAGQAPPSWKTSASVAPGQVHATSVSKGKAAQEQGSRIFLSRLPVDVGEKDVEELFRKTVGPLKESFLVYNSQGNSKGMAVVTFQRPGDALAAQAKYDGKIVDGRRPIKIEIISDGAPSQIPRGPPPPPTLLNRLSPANTMTIRPHTEKINPGPSPVTPIAPRSLVFQPRVAVKPAPVPPRRVRQKKGPKRLKKKTIDDLDKEMEDYRAAAPDPGL